MKFQLVNNHLILKVDTDLGEKTCVYDTGSPLSFFFDKVHKYFLDGMAFYARNNPVMSAFMNFQCELEDLVGMKIDGVIGTDCISDGSVLIDFPSLRLDVNPLGINSSCSIPMKNQAGLPVFKIKVNGIDLTAAFDSGAMFSLASSSMVDELNLIPQNKTFDDYNPLFGHFTGTLSKGIIEVGDTKLGLRNIATGSVYDRAMSLCGLNAFIGVDSLMESTIWISYIDNLVKITV